MGLARREGAEDIEYDEARSRVDLTVDAGGIGAVELVRALLHAVPEETRRRESVALRLLMEDLVFQGEGALRRGRRGPGPA